MRLVSARFAVPISVIFFAYNCFLHGAENKKSLLREFKVHHGEIRSVSPNRQYALWSRTPALKLIKYYASLPIFYAMVLFTGGAEGPRGPDGDKLEIIDSSGHIIKSEVGSIGTLRNFSWTPDGKRYAIVTDGGNKWTLNEIATGSSQKFSVSAAIKAMFWVSNSTIIFASTVWDGLVLLEQNIDTKQERLIAKASFSSDGWYITVFKLVGDEIIISVTRVKKMQDKFGNSEQPEYIHSCLGYDISTGSNTYNVEYNSHNQFKLKPPLRSVCIQQFPD